MDSRFRIPYDVLAFIFMVELIVSRVKKSGVFACLKARVYSSSGPIRYIPKGSSNDEKSRTHLTPEIVNGNDFSSGLDVNAWRIEVKPSAVPRSNFNDTLRDQNQYEKKNYSAGGSMLGICMELFNSLKPLCVFTMLN
uniref:Uncharacterized protein n=1 Tax=Cucumis sativus TaxID=3659 RepID=A0A0A0K741_CUCSA